MNYLQTLTELIAWEKQLKGWSRKKKEALFNEDWEELKRLSKSKKDRDNVDRT